MVAQRNDSSLHSDTGLAPSLNFGFLHVAHNRLAKGSRIVKDLFTMHRARNSNGRNFSAGFTMMEVIVTTGIITITSLAVIFSFSGLGQGVALNRTVRELALAFRRGQNMAITVKEVKTVGGAMFPPRYVGVRLQPNQTSYFIFAETAAGNRSYDSSPDEKVIDTDGIFMTGISIFRIRSATVCNPSCAPPVHVVFENPEARVTFSNALGVLFPASDSWLAIDLRASNGVIRTLTIRTSGQITFQ